MWEMGKLQKQMHKECICYSGWDREHSGRLVRSLLRQKPRKDGQNTGLNKDMFSICNVYVRVPSASIFQVKLSGKSEGMEVVRHLRE